MRVLIARWCLGVALPWLAPAASAQTVEWVKPVFGEQPSLIALGTGWQPHAAVRARDGRVAVAENRSFGGTQYPGVSLLDAATGTQIWHADLPAPCDGTDRLSTPTGVAVELAANGDVIAAVASGSNMIYTTGPYAGCVMRLAAADGHVVWSHVETAAGQFSAVGFLAVAVDADGNVIASGFRSNDGYTADGHVLKLDGASGGTIWSFNDPRGEVYDSFALDMVSVSGGDVVVVFYRGPFSFDPATARAIRIGADGVPVWTVDRNAEGFEGVVRYLRARDDGTVLWVGEPYGSNPVDLTLIDAATGATRWSRSVDTFYSPVADIVSGTSGPIFYAAYDRDAVPPLGHVLWALSPADGSVLWTNSLPPEDPFAHFEFSRLDVAADGDVLAEIIDRDGDNGAPVDHYRSIARYAQADGAQRWSTTLPYEWPNRAVALTDASGNGVLDLATQCWPASSWADCALRADVVDAGSGTLLETTHDAQLGAQPIAPLQAPWAQDQRRPAAFADASHASVFVMGNSDRWLNLARVATVEGSTVWRVGRRDLFGIDAMGSSVAATHRGDAVVVGSTGGSQTPLNDFVTAKFDGADGALLWRRVESMDVHLWSEAATDVAIDPADDVLVAGVVDDLVEVYKYDGASGAPIWHAELEAAMMGAHVAADGAGDVIVLMQAEGGSRVAKLARGDGHVLWSRTETGNELAFNAMAIDAGGDVIVVGDQDAAGNGRSLLALRLRGDTGEIAWFDQSIVAPDASAYAGAVLLVGGQVVIGAASGDACLGAGCGGVDDTSNWLLVSLDAADGSPRWSTTPFADATRDRVTSLDLAQGTLLAAGMCQDHPHCVAGIDPHDGSPLWSVGSGPAPMASFGLGSYPAFASYVGNGVIGFGGYMDFPDGSEYPGWRVTRAEVPVVDAVFAGGFE
ncbi:MAG TPA: PQQ-binding-like beta-propeller repeat protein [Rhodanobacteraceae bacterium]|nr:PQQ-binding-like beta-propeller repeat protein [Rhodanobacteraceae bacterium]